jgi:hypothetical protein
MDVPQFFAPPGRWALSQVIGGDLFGGSRGPAETHRAASDILDAFFRESLLGESGAVTRAAARHREIVGGQVEAGLPECTLGYGRTRELSQMPRSAARPRAQGGWRLVSLPKEKLAAPFYKHASQIVAGRLWFATEPTLALA